MPAKKTAGKPKRGKQTKKGGAATGATRRRTIEDFVQLQQKSVSRVATLWANAADRVAKGNFSLTQLMSDYTNMWGELASDYSKALKKAGPGKR